MQGAVIVGFLSLELEIGNEISYEFMDTVTFLVSCWLRGQAGFLLVEQTLRQGMQRTARVPGA